MSWILQFTMPVAPTEVTGMSSDHATLLPTSRCVRRLGLGWSCPEGEIRNGGALRDAGGIPSGACG